jgi:hypothetical protein
MPIDPNEWWICEASESLIQGPGFCFTHMVSVDNNNLIIRSGTNPDNPIKVPLNDLHNSLGGYLDQPIIIDGVSIPIGTLRKFLAKIEGKLLVFVESQIEVFARWYGYPSVYCQASTPGYRYVVAIPRLPYNIPKEFKKELDSHSSDGDPYFVFEYSDQFLDVAGTFDIPRKHHESWVQCYLIVRPSGGLRFKNEPWV